MAMNWQDRETLAETDALRHAGEAVIALASLLNLAAGPAFPATEYVSAELSSGHFCVWVRSYPPEKAIIRLLDTCDKALEFSSSRAFASSNESEWDESCRKRLVREDIFGCLVLIEPGVVWFVEWLEAHGAQTIFSCEGHPQGFHVTFRAPYPLAHAIAGVQELRVEIFRSKSLPQADQWHLKLRREPESHDERDDLLRDIAGSLASLFPTA